jgi:hypothetical protein
MFDENDTVVMSEDALENYGDEYRDVELRITHKARAYMPASEFFAKGKPEGFHPGFDDGGGENSPLYDLEIVSTGKPLNFSLYEWELMP